QLQVRVDSLFNVGDFYSRNLCSQGHEARDLHINNEILQATWARENLTAATAGPSSGLKALRETVRRHRSNPLIRAVRPLLEPFATKLNGKQNLLNILSAQIRHYRPDVILNQSVQWIPDGFLMQFKPGVKLIAGQIASPLSPDKKLADYDLMVSSLPNFVQRFRSHGLKAELVRLAFEDTILARLPHRKPSIDVSFVGTLSADHESRRTLLETVGKNLDLRIWGRIDPSWAVDSPVRRHHRGDAWGKEMYTILQESRITLNYHIDLAENYANNLRLFEATGVGTLLLTDNKSNIHDLFEPGKEVAVYNSPEECMELARYYVEHESERDAIAKAGQKRTLQGHTYKLRMRELAALLERELRSNTRGAASYSC
ncbi:MAG TPA: glycosyltransferase, partial [Terriglobia bacterium]|nr:glycosyltransferase [Terriglobia bacterium]